MVGSNYPPGMTSRDFVKAGIDQPNHHDCEFRQVRGHNPIIEDGAAIFIRECTYAEGRYGEGWKCEETDDYRFEYDVLETLGGKEIDISPIYEWDEVDEKLKEVVVTIEEAWNNDDPRVEISIHPDKEHGEVTLSFLGYTLNFRPQ